VKIVRTVADLRAALAALPRPVGFVPTMGSLHAGHTALLAAARRECATVVASIFVNPTQFGPGEDFEHYPRDEVRDLALLREHGCDVAFLPSVEEVYPAGDATRVVVHRLTEVLEGVRRPGHFEGVVTVVARLFNMVQPTHAYFGQKDAQQVVVIERMVTDLAMPVTIVRCPIVRESDGLAYSSRNVYLSPDERAQAIALAEGLHCAELAFASGEREPERLRALVQAPIAARPLAVEEYISVADAETLLELDAPVVRPAVISLAVRFGATRLIDNLVLTP